MEKAAERMEKAAERAEFHTPDFSFLIGLVHDFSDAAGNIKRLGCFRVRML